MNFNQKERLKNIANETLDIINKGFYINKNRKKLIINDYIYKSISESELITNNMKSNLIANNEHYDMSNISVIQTSTIDEIIKLRQIEKEGNIITLNFASARHPGGGFLRGSNAQEESIARASALYPCLTKFKKEFYDFHESHRNPLYSDLMIYSPEVPIFRNNAGELLTEPVFSSFITSPAVNAKVAKSNGIKEEIIIEAMKNRIKYIVHLALSKKPKAIILGAYGCGVFGNDPLQVAELFKLAIQTAKVEEGNEEVKIIFAIYDSGEIINKFTKGLSLI